MIEVNEKIDSAEVKTWEEEFNSTCLKSPLVDVVETENSYLLKAAMPGVSKDNVKIKFENKFLTLMGKTDAIGEDAKFTLKESACGNYYRVFRLTDNIDSERIDAEMNNGLLVVTLPKHDRVKARTISIK